MTTVYYTAMTLDGFLATPDHSLDWLFTRDQDPASPYAWDAFGGRVGASVMGANTYQWMLDHVPPGEQTGEPSWVLSHRDFAPADGVTITDQSLEETWAQAREAAGDRDVWLIGGGGLAAQCASAGLLDEVLVSIAPVTLGAGRPLLAGHVELRLEETGRNRDFVCARYSVVK